MIQPPDGGVVLGLGGTFEVPEGGFQGWMRIADRWHYRNENITGFLNYVIYAAPIGSPIALLNGHGEKPESDTPRVDAELGDGSDLPSVMDAVLFARALERELSASHAVIRELYENVESLLSSMERLDLKEGHCMCGASPSKFGYCDNHGYVDAGEYIHGDRMDKAKQALAHAKEKGVGR